MLMSTGTPGRLVCSKCGTETSNLGTVCPACTQVEATNRLRESQEKAARDAQLEREHERRMRDRQSDGPRMSYRSSGPLIVYVREPDNLFMRLFKRIVAFIGWSLLAVFLVAIPSVFHTGFWPVDLMTLAIPIPCAIFAVCMAFVTLFSRD